VRIVAEPHRVVLDTSAVLKWFLPDEPDRGQALAMRDAIVRGEIEPAAPSHLALELAAGLVAAVRRGRLGDEDVQPAIAALASFEIPALDVVSVLGRVTGLAGELGISVYDAAFVATSQAMGAPLVTADEPLRQKVAAAGLQAVALSGWTVENS
jgi:predicted nucleic acid-binding protein